MPRFQVIFWKNTSLHPVHEEMVEAPSLKKAEKLARQLMNALNCDEWRVGAELSA